LNGVNNFNLVGQSRSAQLMFTGVGQMWFGRAGGVSNATLSTLTINANTLPMASPQAAMRFSNAQNVSFNNNQILGHQNGAMPAVFFEGGYNNSINNNTLSSNSGGDSVLQLQTLGTTANSDFTIDSNTFDSVFLVVIGLSNVRITKNILTNKALGNTIGIQVCGPWAGTSQNITIDGNTVDADASNAAYVGGLPNDPGGASNINGFNITNNIIKGTFAVISAQSIDGNNYNDNTLAADTKTNVVISGNQISSAWGASGIDLRGGAGSVDTVLVENNTLQNSAGAQNVITQDNHTYNVTILNNSL
jgi:hypothetical protein